MSLKDFQRLQPTQIALGTTQGGYDVWKAVYEYGEMSGGTVDAAKNSGNIARRTVTFSGLAHPFVQTYTYHPLDRITEAKQTIDSVNYTTRYTYNHSGALIEETYPSGRVVKKVSTSDSVRVVYDAGGKLIEEYDANSGALTTGYVYAGSRLLSTETASGTDYLTADHLGSPRINTDATGSVTARHDYMPFGEELARSGYGSDAVRKQFTGYERDHESELDFAKTRYLSSTLGRFSSVDPYNIIFEKEKGKDQDEVIKILVKYLADPQIWNKYTYVVNNPLHYSDPDGRRPQTDQEKKDLEFLRNFAKTTKDKDLAKAINESVKGIESAIAASKDQSSDPRGLKIALWAINRLAEPDTSRFGMANGTATFTKDGQTVTAGPGQWKCNLFVAAAQALGGGVHLGDNGIPTRWRYGGAGWVSGDVNIPNANTWASLDPNAVKNYELVASPQMGDVAAWSNPSGLGHSSISLGGNLVVYAGEFNVKVNTIANVAASEGTDTVFRRKKE